MANAFLNVYMNNPTAGETDGTAISTDGTNLAPLVVTLNSATNETKKIKLAIRTETGYQTSGDTTISDNGDTNDRWKLCLTEDGEYTDSITFTDTITATNTIFWAQASSASTETPISDRSVSLQVTAVIQAA